MDIGAFIAQLNQSGGVARQNRYGVYFYTDALVATSAQIEKLNEALLQFSEDATDWVQDFFSADFSGTAKGLTAYCDKSELPSYQFATESHRIYGPQFKIPHMPEYQDLTMSFLCGANMYERYFFDTWMYLVMDPTTHNFNYLSEYTADITIVQFTEGTDDSPSDSFSQPSPAYVTTLVDAYPIAISNQELAFDADNTFQRVQVTFTYKYALPFDGATSTAAGKSLRGQKELFSPPGGGGTITTGANAG